MCFNCNIHDLLDDAVWWRGKLSEYKVRKLVFYKGSDKSVIEIAALMKRSKTVIKY